MAWDYVFGHAHIYLTCFYCEETEVLAPGEVFAKADREYTGRYATIVDQIDTILAAAVWLWAEELVVSLCAIVWSCLSQSDSRSRQTLW